MFRTSSIMRSAGILLSFFISGSFLESWAQVPRVPSTESAKHLVREIDPVYPALAKTANIQGNVIVHVLVNESGASSVRWLVSGHPMLVPAAIEAVGKARYRPFEVNGKPSQVMTVVSLRFGSPTNHDAEDSAEVKFQDSFWTKLEEGQAALSSGDLSRAEESLKSASSFLQSGVDRDRHVREQWGWMSTMGDLRRRELKFEVAEQHYRDALKLHDRDKDAPENAAVLANLGRLFAAQKKFELTHEYASRSIEIYRKNFKQASSANPGARQVYGRAIALQAAMLAKLGSERSDEADRIQQCESASEFKEFLSPAERESALKVCEGKKEQ